jgi:hypothetical protein
MMTVISKALDGNAAVTLKSVGWKYDSTDIDPDSAKPGIANGIAASAPGAASGARRQSGLIEGEVQPFTGDYRAAIDEIKKFADALSRQPGVADVKIVKLPLNISPSLTLAGNTSASREQAGRAEFKLVLQLK